MLQIQQRLLIELLNEYRNLEMTLRFLRDLALMTVSASLDCFYRAKKSRASYNINYYAKLSKNLLLQA